MNYPFRVGSTSYIYPDDILPNVRQLARKVQDVELVLFEVDEYGSNLPDPRTIAELNTLALENNLTYTVHLPLDLKFGDAVSFDQAQRAIDSTRDLDPWAYVMHLDGRVLIGEPAREITARWQHEAKRALEKVCRWVGDPTRVCIENVEAWNPDHFRALVAETGVSRCVDIGHLWLQDRDPLPHLIEALERTRVIHLHGIGTRDHQSLTHLAREKLESVVETLLRECYAGVLTLEVFGQDDFFSSIALLLDILSDLKNARAE